MKDSITKRRQIGKNRGEKNSSAVLTEMRTQKQPWLVRILLGLYRPIAGFAALWVAFYPYFRALFNEWFGWNLPKVELNQVVYLAIIGVATTILVFFFGSAHKGGMSAPDRKPGE